MMVFSKDLSRRVWYLMLTLAWLLGWWKVKKVWVGFLPDCPTTAVGNVEPSSSDQVKYRARRWVLPMLSQKVGIWYANLPVPT